MTVVEAGEVLNLKVGENPLLEGEAKTGYVSPDDQDGETASEKPCGAPQLKKGPGVPMKISFSKIMSRHTARGNGTRCSATPGSIAVARAAASAGPTTSGPISRKGLSTMRRSTRF
ncbi:hypothetical protein Zm00014a_001656 [Zea mays]|uniref:Uncharacterized protein n=1 Tax=Zea mays TaxID=4577 RepID=A0A3L6DHG6_MAIZE|nr:hypothetical protein Zm00014a_001656 [Zea mays]